MRPEEITAPMILFHSSGVSQQFDQENHILDALNSGHWFTQDPTKTRIKRRAVEKKIEAPVVVEEEKVEEEPLIIDEEEVKDLEEERRKDKRRR